MNVSVLDSSALYKKEVLFFVFNHVVSSYNWGVCCKIRKRKIKDKKKRTREESWRERAREREKDKKKYVKKKLVCALLRKISRCPSHLKFKSERNRATNRRLILFYKTTLNVFEIHQNNRCVRGVLR